MNSLHLHSFKYASLAVGVNISSRRVASVIIRLIVAVHYQIQSRGVTFLRDLFE